MDPSSIGFMLFGVAVFTLCLVYCIDASSRDCTHKWSKWSDPFTIGDYNSTERQKRVCSKCNRVEERIV